MRSILTTLALLACTAARAVDSTDVPPTPAPAAAQAAPDRLASARAALAAKRWPDAVAELKRANDTKSADWNNLMGYAHRKLTPPDLAAAERHYDAALAINANHRGALEYSGELYLMKGDLARAEQRLTQLARACSACEEHDDLKKAIARFKANGNRYVAAN
jgi:tetratricopeptide (TPR) repeat protein